MTAWKDKQLWVHLWKVEFWGYRMADGPVRQVWVRFPMYPQRLERKVRKLDENEIPAVMLT